MTDFSIMPSVNYSLIGRAIEFYKGIGYEYVEVPWEVSTAAAAMTCLDNTKILHTHSSSPSGKMLNHGSALVGSAEQGFFELWIDNKLPKGSFVACSPCFRLNEPDTPYHFPQFMKVELGKMIYYSDEHCDDIANEISIMRNHARSFFDAHTNHEVKEVKVGDVGEWDLEINDVEVGSYGARVLSNDNIWIYGTGLAEPRFSMVR